MSRFLFYFHVKPESVNLNSHSVPTWYPGDALWQKSDDLKLNCTTATPCLTYSLIAIILEINNVMAMILHYCKKWLVTIMFNVYQGILFSPNISLAYMFLYTIDMLCNARTCCTIFTNHVSQQHLSIWCLLLSK